MEEAVTTAAIRPTRTALDIITEVLVEACTATNPTVMIDPSLVTTVITVVAMASRDTMATAVAMAIVMATEDTLTTRMVAMEVTLITRMVAMEDTLTTVAMETGSGTTRFGLAGICTTSLWADITEEASASMIRRGTGRPSSVMVTMG